MFNPSSSLQRYADDLQSWKDGIANYCQKTGRDMATVCRNELRLLFDRIISGYANNGQHGIAIPPFTKVQGEAAVQNDIRRSILCIAAQDYRDPSIQKAIQSADYAALAVLARRGALGNRFMHMTPEPFNPRMHSSRRNNRGKVPGKLMPALTVDAEKLAAYTKSKIKMVGQAKGGFVAALVALGGSPTQWTARHSDAGSYQEDYASDLEWSFTGINRSRWANAGDEDRIIDQALQARIMSIQTKLEKELAEKAARALQNR